MSLFFHLNRSLTLSDVKQFMRQPEIVATAHGPNEQNFSLLFQNLRWTVEPIAPENKVSDMFALFPSSFTKIASTTQVCSHNISCRWWKIYKLLIDDKLKGFNFRLLERWYKCLVKYVTSLSLTLCTAASNENVRWVPHHHHSWQVVVTAIWLY